MLRKSDAAKLRVTTVLVFCRQKGGWSFVGRLILCFFTLVLVDARLFPRTWACPLRMGMRLAFPRRVG